MRKYTKYILLPVGAWLAMNSLLSCGENRWPEYYPFTGKNLWIDELMREEYLWYEEMPSFNDLNYFLSPDKFIAAVRSEKDKGFTKTDSLYPKQLPTYGFTYQLNKVSHSDSTYFAMITDVLPQSPAQEAGLQRGQWIMKVDNDSITKKKEDLLKEGGKKTLAIGEYKIRTEQDAEGQDIVIKEVVATGNVNLAAACPVAESTEPAIFFLQNNRTAYLRYLQFDVKWDATLLDFSNACNSHGVTEVILDLRNNQEGNLQSVQKLATLLVPAHALGQRLAHLEYNAKKSDKNRDLMLEATLIQGGQNLNLSRIFVLTGENTAGPAEMLINCLKPFMEVVLIGTNTRGEYVATEPFTNPEFQWRICPAVCYVYNNLGENDYQEGFTPDKSIQPLSDPAQVLPYGNPQEALLSVALGMIDGSIEIPQEQPNE